MNCQKFEVVVNDIAREQIIDAGTRAEALRHSDDCRSCAARLANERMITEQLRELAKSAESASAPARVEARLLAAFDAIAAVHSPAPMVPTVSAGHYQRRYWATAIAAGLLFVFGVSAALWRQALPVNRDTAATLVADAGSSFAINTGSATNLFSAPTVKPDAGGADSRRKSASKHSSPANLQPDNAANTEIATDFLPMSYGSTANLQDGGQMVRVELPRSAMASFGLPVNMDRANERLRPTCFWA